MDTSEKTRELGEQEKEVPQMAVQTATRQIVMSDRFLAAYDNLPANVRSRVRDRLETLQTNPAHPSLNYETIKNAGDPRMRSMRVNDNYRIILAHPDGSGTYVLLWVDTHDDAYIWAMRHRLDEGDARRGLTIVMVDERNQSVPPEDTVAPVRVPTETVLKAVTDDELAAAGVPQGLIPALRSCQGEEDLLAMLIALRQEVAEAVMCLALGEPVPAQHVGEGAEAEPELAGGPREGQHMDPMVAALQNPESGRRFVVLSSQLALELALTYPLERWRLFLHPDQRATVERRFAGPALVSGGAGTGKTVVGLHRARFLAEHIFTDPADRILLTTFTRNLAQNLSQLMDSLCGGDNALRRRIEVTHVHSLASNLRLAAGERFGLLDDNAAAAIMAKAVEQHDTLGLPASFYVAEWNEVAQERDALSLDAYKVVSRDGRGKALNRAQREAIWPVFDAHRRAVAEAKREEWPSVFRRVCELVHAERVPRGYRYRAAVVDEAQDMGSPEMRLILALVGTAPDSLLLLGDSRQQIYARGSYVRTLSIPIARRHVRLRVNYRTTDQIRAAAAAVAPLATALNGEALGPEDAISLLSGPQPSFRGFPSPGEEEAAVVTAIRNTLTSVEPHEIAVVARTGQQVQHYIQSLSAAGITCAKLTSDGALRDGVQVGTMHRVKGLEFRAVYIVGCSADVMPAPYHGEDSDAARADHEERERHLLYVAMTRARELLWVSAGGMLSELLEGEYA